MNQDIDIKEDEIAALSPGLLAILLKDHTMSTHNEQVNIFWATDNYTALGEGYSYADQITVDKITGESQEESKNNTFFDHLFADNAHY